MQILAAILEQSNAPLTLAQIDVPALDVGQVLVKIHQSGICGAQLNEIAAVKGPDKFLPHMLGHEGGGEVVEVGPGVTIVKPGDHVVMHWRKGTGIQSKPAVYRWGDRVVNSGWVTTFSEYSVVSENRLTKIDNDIPYDIASLMGCAVTTAFGLINHDAHVEIGQSVAILGCGGVGLSMVQGAALVAANPIIAIDIYDHKLNLACEFGATHTINTTRSDLREEICRIVGPRGVDVFIETTGLVKLIELAYGLTGPEGRTHLVGVPRFDENVNIHTIALHHGKVLTGCEGGHTNPTVDIPRYLRLYQSGKLKLDRLITHRYPLSEINIALDKIRAGEVGRCILSMN